MAFLIGATWATSSKAKASEPRDLFWTAFVFVLLGVGSSITVRLPMRNKQHQNDSGVPEKPAVRAPAKPALLAADRVLLLTELLRLGEEQLADLWAEAREQNTYALGLAGVGVTIMSILAVAQTALGADWWVPIPGLTIAIGIALVGTNTARKTYHGPDPAAFYDLFSEHVAEDALSQLLADVGNARIRMAPVLRKQRIWLYTALTAVVLTALYSLPLLV